MWSMFATIRCMAGHVTPGRHHPKLNSSQLYWKLLEFLYENYRLDSQELTTSPASQFTDLPDTLPAQKSWLDSLLDSPSEASNFALYSEELRDYFDGRYRYNGGEVLIILILIWWKEHETHFPVLSRIARDFLAIPATSVSVEHLFPRCKLVMSDYRNMSVETARKIITSQQ
ncbi:hypothetical protein ACGC1H_002229 [Rhizoctonia solani]